MRDGAAVLAWLWRLLSIGRRRKSERHSPGMECVTSFSASPGQSSSAIRISTQGGASNWGVERRRGLRGAFYFLLVAT